VYLFSYTYKKKQLLWRVSTPLVSEREMDHSNDTELYGIQSAGTGKGLPLAGIAATTFADATETTTPATTAVPQLDQEVAGVHSGIAVPAGGPTTTIMGVNVAGTGPSAQPESWNVAPEVENTPQPSHLRAHILMAIDGPSPSVGSGATAPYGVATSPLEEDILQIFYMGIPTIHYLFSSI
jgi:hypothetical protein